MNDIETQVENNEYVKLVWKTLESWYLKFAEFTPNLVVGILVFLFFYFSFIFMTVFDKATSWELITTRHSL